MSSAAPDLEAGVGQGLRPERRLRPLFVGAALQNFALWIPVEKVFQMSIGFNALSIAVVAAAYGATVPLLEVPFGVVADRWSRTKMMAVASLALAASSLIGGLSHSPMQYAIAAVLLGVYLALNSGTADSVVYDVLIEHSGTSTGYERWLGRLHVVESGALVVSAVLGSALAALTSPRVTYFATVPAAVLAAVVLLRVDEPQLHRQTERITLRRQAATTFRALVDTPRVRRVVLLAALAAAAAQLLIEFGPLWLVALHAPTALYGPYWAVLVAFIAVGAWLASRVPMNRTSVLTLGLLLTGSAVVSSTVTALPAVLAAHLLVGAIVSLVGVRAGFLLHEAVSANVRAGVSSGASTLSWLVFLPVSLLFGWVSHTYGVETGGWLLVGLTAGTGMLLLGTVAKPSAGRRERRARGAVLNLVVRTTE
jgi:hypothetical protein